jgi:hypothetical protein
MKISYSGLLVIFLSYLSSLSLLKLRKTSSKIKFGPKHHIVTIIATLRLRSSLTPFLPDPFSTPFSAPFSTLIPIISSYSVAHRFFPTEPACVSVRKPTIMYKEISETTRSDRQPRESLCAADRLSSEGVIDQSNSTIERAKGTFVARSIAHSNRSIRQDISVHCRGCCYSSRRADNEVDVASLCAVQQHHCGTGSCGKSRVDQEDELAFGVRSAVEFEGG